MNCPQGAEIYNAKYFSSPTDATPDYFNVCALPSNNSSVPSNLGGYQMPHTGNAYGGLIGYGFNTNYKEYIQTPLLSALENGKYYYIEYYVCLGNYASVGCNNLGILFTQSINYQNINTTMQKPNALFNSKVIVDTLNWTKINFYYKGTGTENYLIIGNFKDDSITDTLTSFAGGNDVYYCIDDISVTMIEYQIPNVFTPNADNINDVFYFNTDIIKAKELLIYNRWGIKMFQSSTNYSWDGRTTAGEECAAGTYYYVIQTETETHKGFLELIR